MQDYVVNLVVQKFGVQIFNDGIRQTLRLSYQEFMNQRSGETLSILQSVRTDTERFINAFINILFSSLVGIGFLMWYAVTKSWTLVPVFVIGILGLGGLTGLLSSRIKTLQRSIKRETNRMSGVITESLRNIELVKSLGLTFQEIRRLRDHTQEIFDLELAKERKVRTLTLPAGLGAHAAAAVDSLHPALADLPEDSGAGRVDRDAVHHRADLHAAPGPRQHHHPVSRGGRVAADLR